MIAETYGNPSRDEINLIEEEDEVLVRLFVADVLLDASAAGAHGVTSIENVDDDVGRVDDLVELTPNTS